MLTEDVIHNLYLHMSGKAEGIAEATGAADFPVLFANAILEYAKRPWVGLTGAEVNHIFAANVGYPERMMKEVEAKLKEKNT